MRSAFVAALALMLATPLTGQARTGVVDVTIQESMGMVAGILVRSAGQSATTDAAGRARLTLPAGRQVLLLTRVGFTPARIPVTVVADSTVTASASITMERMAMLDDVKVTATRIEKLAGDTPDRVEVLDEMEVVENTLMAPSGITMLLNETPGIRVFAASPTLGTGSVRILGLPGQYTAMLADGLPLYGGGSSALGPLDISPVDLQRVEIIKGAASALYGAQALGGVINLVSRPATGKSEVLLNTRMMGVTDAATWMSRTWDNGAGLSLLASGSTQRAWDFDDDGWADQAQGSRWGVRPRFTWADDFGRSVFLTAGYGYDARSGGTLGGALTPGGTAFREGLTSRRADIGATAKLPVGDSGNIAFRGAVSNSSREREFGSGPLEKDGTSTGFVEITHTFSSARRAFVVGTSLQFDQFENSLNASYDRRWLTPSLFLTQDVTSGPLTVSLSARGDKHPEAGTRLTWRMAGLLKAVDEWSVRVSVGSGFAPPTGTIEETEAIGLRTVQPKANLAVESSLGTMVDVSGRLLGAELLVTAYRSLIENAVQFADSSFGGGGAGFLRSAIGYTEIGGLEGAAIWRWEGGKFLGTYGYSRGTRTDAVTGFREWVPLIPRHRLGGDLMFEKEKAYRWGVEGIWYGKQALDENPYRTESKPYVYLMAIFVRQFGGVELAANFENILNVKQSDTDRLLRPTQTTGGRWTTDVWAPLEGFMANVALRYRW